MSLFVGNLSRNVGYEELREVFERKGRCTIHIKDGYAFVDYDNDDDAEAAKADLS